MIIGLSANHKDKRIDKILVQKGFVNTDIFYSPIQSWFLALLLMYGYAFLPITVILIAKKFYFLIGSYFIIGLLINFYLNNSFAIDNTYLHIINPNLLKGRIKSRKLSEIKNVAFRRKKNYLLYVFGIFYCNYIEVETDQDKETYFCIWLDKDAYDENWTEKTLDDFKTKLEEIEIKTTIHIEEFNK